MLPLRKGEVDIDAPVAAPLEFKVEGAATLVGDTAPGGGIDAFGNNTVVNSPINRTMCIVGRS